MAVPTLSSITPVSGPASGSDLVRLVGTGFAAEVRVRVGVQLAVVVAVRDEAGVSIADVRTPSGEQGRADVALENLDATGNPIPGESVTLPQAYRFLRTPVAPEADLTRVVRQLLRELKRQVLANVSTTVSVDYDDSPSDGLNIVAMASLPCLVLSGPTLRDNRFYSTNESHEDVVAGTGGLELQRRKTPFTTDLVFTLTDASNRTAQLLNLMAAVATFLNRNRWLELVRDPARSELGSVRWELAADGEFVTAS